MPQEDDLLKLVAGSDASGDKASQGQESPEGPMGAPSTTAQKPEGAQVAATAKIALAMKLLSQALPPYGADSEKGGALMKSISSLQRTFGVKLDEGEKLIPAELKMLMEAADMKTPEQQAASAPAAAKGPTPPMAKAA